MSLVSIKALKKNNNKTQLNLSTIPLLAHTVVIICVKLGLIAQNVVIVYYQLNQLNNLNQMLNHLHPLLLDVDA